MSISSNSNEVKHNSTHKSIKAGFKINFMKMKNDKGEQVEKIIIE